MSAPVSQVPQKPRVLVVDDEPAIVSALARILARAGYDVDTAADGSAALAQFGRGGFDVVLSDIHMPGMDGMALLKRLRETDLDIPVILLTGEPSLDTAMKAIEYGAMRYLPKPPDETAMLEMIAHAVRLRRLAALRRDATTALGGQEIGDRAGLESRFDSAVQKSWMAFQPVVESGKKRIWGYEALVRSEEPTLRSPDLLFDAAERLDRVHQIGRVLRRKVAEKILEAPVDARILVNLHPKDLLDEELYARDAPLAAFAERVVLEVTERASLDDVTDLTARVRRLRAIGYRVALDDLGAGYAGLTTFTRLEPDIVKLDMVFARGIERDFTKQHLVKSIVAMCADLHIRVIAEGIEEKGERSMLVSLGCELLQGYLFAKPGPPFPVAQNW